MKENSFNFQNIFRKKNFENDISDLDPVYDYESGVEKQKKIYDQQEDFLDDSSSSLFEEHGNKNQDDSMSNEIIENQVEEQNEQENVSVIFGENEVEKAHFEENNLKNENEIIKEEYSTTGPTTRSGNDEQIEGLKKYIVELENENELIPALKTEVEKLKEEIEELQRGINNPFAAKVELGEESDGNSPLELTKMVYEGFMKLEKQFNTLSKEFNTKLKIDESKEKIIDNLHTELQSYKDDQIKDIVKPLVNDLILMADRTRKIVEGLEKEEELYQKKLLRLLNDCIQDIEDILYRQGIEAFTCESDSFDTKRQQIVKMIKTDDQSKDKKVAEIIGKGYEWDGKLFRHEKVNIFVFERAKEK